MKLFKSFTALKSAAISVTLCACSLSGQWVLPEYDLASVPLRSPGSAAAVLAHSHNDYEQDIPLMDALMHGFDSVEADIWLRGKRFLVSHMGWNTKGTLEELYLDPLQELVRQRGSVFGDGQPFYLWIDIKRYEAGLSKRLHEVLSSYPMLSKFSAEGEKTGAVTVILTGSERAKTEYVRLHDVRYASRDSRKFHGSDPPASGEWSWYSLKWNDLFKWEGRGEMPIEEWAGLKELVGRVHSKGRRVRFWAVPQTEEFWAAAAAAGVDALQTDSLPRLRTAIARMREFLPVRTASRAAASSTSPGQKNEPERAGFSATLRLLSRDLVSREHPLKDVHEVRREP